MENNGKQRGLFGLYRHAITTIIAIAGAANVAHGARAVTVPLVMGVDKGDGQTPRVFLRDEPSVGFYLKGDVGYVFNFAGGLAKTGGQNSGNNNTGKGGNIAYGVTLGWNDQSGVGVAVDYLGLSGGWSANDPSGLVKNTYSARYDIVTFLPSYRFTLLKDQWWLRVGLGMGVNISRLTWGGRANAATGNSRVTSGAIYKDANATYHSDGTGGATANFANRTPAINAACTYGIYFDSNLPPEPLTLLDKITGVAVADYTTFMGYTEYSTCMHDYENVVLNPNPGPPHTPTFYFLMITDNDIVNGLKNKSIVYGGGAVARGVWTQLTDTLANLQLLADATEYSLKIPPDYNAGTMVTIDNNIWRSLSTSQQRAMIASGAVTNSDLTALGGTSDVAIGFVIAPQIGVECEYGLFHADVNIRYFHELTAIKYYGGEGVGAGAQQVLYSAAPGPLGVYLGGGLGVNF
ncbi:MAG: hypothetical protein QM529_07695 [Hydrotalea sp.]|nr:hypothetical protein [Hydrotalea sp.]